MFRVLQSSFARPAQDGPGFPNYQYLLQARTDKYLKVKDYKVVHDRALNVKNLAGYEELVEMLE